MNFKSLLRGTGVAVITPFSNDDQVDYPALGSLLDFLIQNGVNYIVTLGTTGETPVLTKEEKKAIIDFTYKQVNNRVPVVVGIGGNNTAEVIADLQSYDLSQAAAVLSASPYYNKPSQEGLYQHYKALAAHSPRPIILYNVPGRTGRNMTAQTTIRLANEVGNIIGIKEASGDMQQCMEIIRDSPSHFLVVSGDDALAMPQIACGMQGVISVAANAFPNAFCKMVNHALAFEMDEARSINEQLMKAYDIMFAENNPAGVKAFLAQMNRIQNNLRLPSVPLSAPLQQQVVQFLNL